MVSQYCPYGYVEANGAVLPVSEYQALYSLVGTTFGGDGRNTFGIPNLRARTPVGWGSVAGLTPVAYGQYVGQQSVMLTPTMMAPHNHSATFTPGGGGGSGAATASGPVSIPVTGSVSGLPFSATANLSVQADANIGTSNTAGRSQNVSNNALLTSTNFGNANPYAPSTNTPAIPIGPANSVTGTATGTVSGTASGGTLSGTASGTISLPVSGGGGSTGGTVTVGTNIQPAQQVVTPVRDPVVGLTACIATLGTYPTRP